MSYAVCSPCESYLPLWDNDLVAADGASPVPGAFRPRQTIHEEEEEGGYGRSSCPDSIFDPPGPGADCKSDTPVPWVGRHLVRQAEIHEGEQRVLRAENARLRRVLQERERMIRELERRRGECGGSSARTVTSEATTVRAVGSRGALRQSTTRCEIGIDPRRASSSSSSSSSPSSSSPSSRRTRRGVFAPGSRWNKSRRREDTPHATDSVVRLPGSSPEFTAATFDYAGVNQSDEVGRDDATDKNSKAQFSSGVAKRLRTIVVPRRKRSTSSSIETASSVSNASSSVWFARSSNALADF